MKTKIYFVLMNSSLFTRLMLDVYVLQYYELSNFYGQSFLNLLQNFKNELKI